MPEAILPSLLGKPRLDKPLDTEQIKELCAVAGPCFTILVPSYRPAAQSAPESVSLKHLLRVAVELPAARKHGQEAGILLEPLRELAEDEELEAGGKALALFSAPGFAAGYRVAAELGQKSIFARHPLIRPLLAEAFAPRELFALGLSRKHIRLFRCVDHKAEELDLPPGIPKSFAEASNFDQPDHDLQNRSSSGASSGSGFAVTFGTLSDRESAPEYLHNYFALMDRSLAPLLKNTPVFLRGVAEDLAAFRKAARHLNILEAGSEGGSDFRGADDIGALARSAALVSYRRKAESAFQDFREMPNRNRTLTGPTQILTAAEKGRVHRVVIADEDDAAAKQASHRQDLLQGEDALNAIAVETIRRGGEVFTLPHEKMGDAAPVAAILRY
ncbi:MAG TPA: hypothetical protein VH639_07170 [Bryobacteraceae bacterium]|jgi:hypothetical protein